MKTNLLFTSIAILLPLLATAQNHWDVEYNGLPVKQETLLHYSDTDKEHTGLELIAQDITSYYSDGSIDQVKTIAYGDTTISYFLYDQNVLKKIVTRSFRSDIYFGSVIEEVEKDIFPLKGIQYETYKSDIDMFDSETNIIRHEYNKKMQKVTSSGELSNNRGRFIIKRMYDKKGALKYVTNEFFNPDSNEGRKSTDTIKVIKTDKAGWTILSINDGERRQKRSLTYFTEQELKDPENVNKMSAMPVSFEELLGAFQKQYGEERTFSGDWKYSEEQLKRLKLLTDHVRNDPEKYRTEHDLNIAFLYEQQIKAFVDHEQPDKALQTALEGLELATFEDESKINDLNNKIAGIYAVKGDTAKAVEYFDKVYNYKVERDLDLYDMDFVISLATEHYKLSNQARADEILAIPNQLINELYNKNDWQSVNREVFSILEKLAGYYETSGDLLKAEKYLQTVADYYKRVYGEDDQDYKDTLSKLIKVKKKILSQG
ncbi:MAG: hypothetical protein ACNS60_10585 [Candidatus Cyclobacteriaceae bacterium M2_1C_046]